MDGRVVAFMNIGGDRELYLIMYDSRVISYAIILMGEVEQLFWFFLPYTFFNRDNHLWFRAYTIRCTHKFNNRIQYCSCSKADEGGEWGTPILGYSY